MSNINKLSVGVNLIGSYATSDEMKKNKSVIEDIINTITDFMCESDKSLSGPSTVLSIKNIISNRFPNYDKLCIQLKPDGSCDGILFTDAKISDIMDKIQNNSEYRRICKFKYKVFNGIIANTNYRTLKKILYPLNYYPVQNFSFPYPYLPIIHLNGGSKTLNVAKGQYNLGELDIDGEKIPIKFADFDSFIEQYEDYHTVQNNVMYVKSCKNINGKVNCKSKIYKLNQNNDSDSESELESESEKMNVLTHGKDTNLDNAYKALFNIKSANNAIELLNEIDKLLDYIKYYTLPIKTLKIAEQTNSKISQN